MKGDVICDHGYAGVKKGKDGTFDIWEWSIAYRKWVRLSQTGQGFADAYLAGTEARTLSEEIEKQIKAATDPNRPKLT